MKKLIIAAALSMTVIIGAVSAILVFAYSTQEEAQTPYGIEIESDANYSGTDYQGHYRLNKDNGDIVNFYIENTGSVDIYFKINEEVSRTISPGKSGYISASVIKRNQKFYFKAVPTPNGGDISMKFRIAQRSSKAYK